MTYYAVWSLKRGLYDHPEPIPSADQDVMYRDDHAYYLMGVWAQRERDPDLSERQYRQEELRRDDYGRSTWPKKLQP